jgi:hypothetical protein
MTIPAVCTAANDPMLRPRRSSPMDSASVASSSGLVNAFAAPSTARSTRNGTTLDTSAVPNDATAYTTYAERIVRARPSRSPSVPETS